jgi:hypothetical protein
VIHFVDRYVLVDVVFLARTNNRQVQQTAFLASLGTSLGISAVIVLLFCFIRPYNATVYAPKLKHTDEKRAPLAIGKSPWAWLIVVIKEKEESLVEKVGLDAAIFIRFTHMCRNIFLVLSLVGCCVLIPVNVVGGKQFATKGTPILTRMTPQFMIGQIYWALVACAWIIDIVVCVFLWMNYRVITRLRCEYFESADYQNSLRARTLMVTAIPNPLRTDEGLLRIVDGVKTTLDIPRAAIARNVKHLPDLIEEHEETVMKLEKVLAKYLKNPDSLPAKRPLIKPSKKDTRYLKSQKVDAITYLLARMQNLEGRIHQVRESIDQRNALSYGFASYESVEEAHGVAFAARKIHPHGSTIRLASRPSDLIWKNLGLSKKILRSNRIVNTFYIVLLIIFWTICNAFLAIFLANLANLGEVWQGFNTELHKNPKTWAVVQGVASPAITSAFYYFLPIIFRRLSMRAGDLTKTSRERQVLRRLYAFFVFNNLIVFSLFGALWSFIVTVIGARNQGIDVGNALKDGDIWTKIMIALCNVSPFWMSWLLQRNLGAVIDLAQFVNLAWGSIVRRFTCPTPRELIKNTAPPPFDYACYYHYFLFYATVAMCFATLQPLVLPVTALYFVLDTYLKKYLIMYVFLTKRESGGKFWGVVFDRFLFACFLSNVVVACLVKAKAMSFWISMFGALAPLPFLLIAFKIYCMRTFDHKIDYYTKGLKSTESDIAPNSESRHSSNVAIRFGHPALYKPLMTPMVHAKLQNVMRQMNHRRLDGDDTALLRAFSDATILSDMKKDGPIGQRDKSSGSFEFVSEADMDFSHFKDRADFRADHGSEGDLYGKPDDLIRGETPGSNRTGSASTSHIGIDPRNERSYGNHSRTESRDSEEGMSDVPLAGVTYPAGYHQTPWSASRGYSPSPGQGGLVHSTAPMVASGYRDRGVDRRASLPDITPNNERTSYGW